MANKPKIGITNQARIRRYNETPGPEKTFGPEIEDENLRGKAYKEIENQNTFLKPEPEYGPVYEDEGFNGPVPAKKKSSNVDPGFSRSVSKADKKVAAKIVAEQTKPKGTQPGHAVTSSKNFTKKSK